VFTPQGGIAGTGGSVLVGYDGTSTATGNIILLNWYTVAQTSHFEVTLREGMLILVQPPRLYMVMMEESLR
jgi:hypothetical protein